MNCDYRFLIILLPLALLVGCERGETSGNGKPPQVYTTFYPTTYFTERIAGDRAKVVCPLPEGADPIFWNPPPETIAKYQQADLIVINGAGFEKWVEKISLPQSKLVDTAAPLAKDFVKFEGTVTHSHGTGGDHSHEGIDGHTWLDPRNAKIQAGEIRKALATLVPADADVFQRNYTALAGELDELDRSLAELSESLQETPLLASHPAYNYLARRYEWDVTNLDLDPATMPDDATIKEIKTTLETKPAKIILWESPPEEEIAKRLDDELGLKSILFSPCETAGDGQDYIETMRENIARLREAIGK